MLQTSEIANWGIVTKLSRITDFYIVVIRFVWALKGPGGQSYKQWGKSHTMSPIRCTFAKIAFFR
jgi:hypothetical protein